MEITDIIKFPRKETINAYETLEGQIEIMAEDLFFYGVGVADSDTVVYTTIDTAPVKYTAKIILFPKFRGE